MTSLLRHSSEGKYVNTYGSETGFNDVKLKFKWVRLTAFKSSQDKKGTTTGLCQSDSARLVPVKFLQE